MPYMDEAELVRSIKRGDVAPCYFFWGKDTATAEAYAKRLRDRLVSKDQRDLNYHFMPAAEFSSAELADIAEALPMFADRTVTLINDLNAETLKQDSQKQLFDVISSIDKNTTTFIFYATGIDLAGGKKNLTAKNKKLCDHISKCGGIVTEFAEKRPNELVKHIQSRMSANGCFISPVDAEYLAAIQNCSILMIDNECDKLCSYVGFGGGEITRSVIDLLVSDQLDTDAYKLSKAILSGKSAEAFKILNKLDARQAEPLMLLATVSVAFMDLYRAKTALIGGYSENNMKENFSYGARAFAVRNAFRDCMSVPLERLRYALSVLSECDAQMKSSRTDSKILLEQAIAKILSNSRSNNYKR